MVTVIVGGVVILLALMTPASELLHFLRPRPGDRLDELLSGITLFKYSLMAFGFFLIVLGRLPVWEQATRGEKVKPVPPHHSLNLTILTGILCVATVLRL